MTKLTLVLIGIIVIVMGFLSIVPQIPFATMPLWYGILLIVVGLVSAIVGLMAKRPGSKK
jgi:uncharacterized membrane protein HdeD (DUF308 family)